MPEKYIDFLSRECKSHLHERCYGKWCGLSFEIYCYCDCHKNKALAQVGEPGANAAGNDAQQPSFMEGIPHI